MTAVYLTAAVIGAPFVVFFVLAGFDSVGSPDGAPDDDALTVADFLTLRSLAFLGAFFGVTGMLMSGLGVSVAISVPVSAGVGLFAMWLNARLVSLVRGVGSDITGDMVVGREAEVVVPFGSGTDGTIALDVGGQVVELVATAHREETFAAGDGAIIVEVDEAAARVVSPGAVP